MGPFVVSITFSTQQLERWFSKWASENTWSPKCKCTHQSKTLQWLPISWILRTWCPPCVSCFPEILLHSTARLPLLTGLSAPVTCKPVPLGLGLLFSLLVGPFPELSQPTPHHSSFPLRETPDHLPNSVQVIVTGSIPGLSRDLQPLKLTSFLAYCLSPTE